MGKRKQSIEAIERETKLLQEINDLKFVENRLRGDIARSHQELDELKEKYALLLRKYISMMERCVGIIPKIRKQEEEDDG